MTPKQRIETAIAKANLPRWEYDEAMTALTLILARKAKLEKMFVRFRTVCFESSVLLAAQPTCQPEFESGERTVAADYDTMPTMTPVPLTRAMRKR